MFPSVCRPRARTALAIPPAPCADSRAGSECWGRHSAVAGRRLHSCHRWDMEATRGRSRSVQGCDGCCVVYAIQLWEDARGAGGLAHEGVHVSTGAYHHSCHGGCPLACAVALAPTAATPPRACDHGRAASGVPSWPYRHGRRRVHAPRACHRRRKASGAGACVTAGLVGGPNAGPSAGSPPLAPLQARLEAQPRV